MKHKKIAMPIRLSSTEALQKLESLHTLGNDPGFLFPAFCVETEFITLFAHIIEENPIRNNIIPLVGTFINKAFERSIDQVFDILDEHKITGVQILSLMCQKKLIRNREKKELSKTLRGKAAKSSMDTYLNAYNNWLLAAILWKAYVRSHDPGYGVHITKEEDSDAPAETFNDPNYRPLWVMKQACLGEAGDPTHGSGNEDIFIRPLREWYRLTKQKRLASKSSTIA